MSDQQEIPFVECQDYSGKCNCPQIFASEQSDRETLEKEIQECKCKGPCEHKNVHFNPKKICKCETACEILAHYQICKCRIPCKIVLNKPTYHPRDKSVISVVNKICIKGQCYNNKEKQTDLNCRQIVIHDEKFLKIFQETNDGIQLVTKEYLGSICICLKHFGSKDIRFFWRHGYLHPNAEIKVLTKETVLKGIPSEEQLEKTEQRRHKQGFRKMQVSLIALEPATCIALIEHIENLEKKLPQIKISEKSKKRNRDEDAFNFEFEEVDFKPYNFEFLDQETEDTFTFKFVEEHFNLELQKFNDVSEIYLEISHATSADKVEQIFEQKKELIQKARRIYFIFEYFSNNNKKACGLYQWHVKESQLFTLLPCPLPKNGNDFLKQHNAFLISVLRIAHLLDIPSYMSLTEQFRRSWAPSQMDEPDSYFYILYFINHLCTEQGSFSIKAPFDNLNFEAFKTNHFLFN